MKLVLAFAIGVLCGLATNSATAQTPVTFTDDFNRPDGPVGNGWLNATDNVGGNLVIRNDSLTTPSPNPGGSAGIDRPIGYGGTVTFSATLTPGNGFGGLQNRYTTAFVFRNDGTQYGGYGLNFYRGDQNYSDSAVQVFYNGVQVASAASSFQFGASITVTASLSPDGSIAGQVSGDGNTFQFSFGSYDLSGLSGTNFGITVNFPDTRTSITTYPTVDNVSITYEPQFAGTPGNPDCHGDSVSALAQQYGGLNAAAAALSFPSVRALQNSVSAFCDQ